MKRIDNSNKIYSKQSISPWFFIIPGILIISYSALYIAIRVIDKDYALFDLIVSSLFGALIAFIGWRMRKKFLITGYSPLTLSPAAGQTNGQLGGRIELEAPWEKRDLVIVLSCIHSTRQQTTKRSYTKREVIWRNTDKPVDRPSGMGSKLEFCFDLPTDAPATGAANRGSIHWELSVVGKVKGIAFQRQWKVPVVEGSEKSLITIPKRHQEAVKALKTAAAEAKVEQHVQENGPDEELHILSNHGRSISKAWSNKLVGGILSLVGAYGLLLALLGSGKALALALAFLIPALSLFGLEYYFSKSYLELKVKDNLLILTHQLKNHVFYKHNISISDIEALSIESCQCKMNFSSTSKFLAVYVHIKNRWGGEKIKLVGGITSQEAAEIYKDKISVALNDSTTDSEESASTQDTLSQAKNSFPVS